MTFGILIILLCTLLLKVSDAQPPSKCEVPIKTGTPCSNEPVYLDTDFNLWAPSKKFTWNNGAYSYAVCTGFSNAVTKTGNQMVKITCSNGKFKLDDDNTLVEFVDVVCKEKIVVEENFISETCPFTESGQLFEIGFNIRKSKVKKEFVALFESCCDLNQGLVHYTKHTIHGQAIEDTVSCPDANWVIIKYYHDNFTKWYKQEAQQKRLVDLLGAPSENRYQFDTTKYYFARGHLMPCRDSIFRTWKLNTFNYFNAMPQWQVINNGNWRVIETKVRQYAAKHATTVAVTTGVYGQLQLLNASSKLTDITLGGEDANIPAPLWVYKKIRVDNKNLVFHTLNNPFATELPSQTHKCHGLEDECANREGKKNSEWYNESFKIFAKGYTVCCFETVRDRRPGN